MIKFKRMAIDNFMSVGHAKIDLSDQGLILIEGVNEDDPSAMSNGSGKSSIVDAISWCLYGETARGSAGDSIVNIKTGKDTRVAIWMEVDGDTYVIQRGRKHPTLKNRVELAKINAGPSTVLTCGTDKLTQEKINHLLGCTADVFNAAIYMGQEAMPDLPGMTDKALKNILEQALSLDKLDEALTVCKARVDAVTYTLEKTKDNLSKEKSKRYDCQATKDRLELSLVTLQKELKDAQDIYVEEVNLFKARRKNTEENIRRAKKLIEEVTKEIQPEDMSHKVVMDEFDKDISNKNKSLNAIQNDLAEEIWKLEALYKESTALKTDKNCPTCGKACDEDPAELATKIAAMEADIALSQRLIAGMRSTRDAAEKKLGSLREERQRVAAEHAKATAENNRNIANKSIFERDLMWENKSLKESDEAFMKVHGMVTKGIESKEEKIKETRADIVVAENRIRAADFSITALEREEGALVKVLEDLNKVAYILGRKGFRGEVLDQITPFLNLRTNHYLSQLSNDNMTATWDTIAQNSAGDFVESFHITVRHTNGIEKFALLSGGEKRKVRLACALALQDLISSRAVKPIKLFIADEIDDAIDGAGLELLMSVLEQKAKDVGTVMIISHNDISDWVRNKITIVKKDGQATFKTHPDPA